MKPGGRLGVVIPESLLNTADAVDVRLFLYRTFWIRAIVGLPRNIFIETPTLTSLLFAQKKTAQEIEKWDNAWHNMLNECERKKIHTETFLRETRKQIKRREDPNMDLPEIQRSFVEELYPIVSTTTSIMKKGGGPVTIALPSHIITIDEACKYYLEMMKLASFDQLVRNIIFSKLCQTFDYEYPVYLVDEVGYKLSKRKERIRPNQLCRFVTSEELVEVPNLHLAKDAFELVIDKNNPERILDYIRRDVKWK